jgi:hypothetical protein
MKIKTLVITLLFAMSMWAQNAAPTSTADQGKTQAAASCCKDGAACCKDGATCCGGDMAKGASCCKNGAECCKAGAGCCGKMAKGDKAKSCCGGKMCDRHKGQKA